jgi:hypothetical protein
MNKLYIQYGFMTVDGDLLHLESVDGILNLRREADIDNALNRKTPSQPWTTYQYHVFLRTWLGYRDPRDDLIPKLDRRDCILPMIITKEREGNALVIRYVKANMPSPLPEGVFLTPVTNKDLGSREFFICQDVEVGQVYHHSTLCSKSLTPRYLILKCIWALKNNEALLVVLLDGEVIRELEPYNLTLD